MLIDFYGYFRPNWVYGVRNQNFQDFEIYDYDYNT